MRHILSILVENEAGRAVADFGTLFGARLQHRVADRRADRRPDDVADDDRHQRLRRRHRADHEAVEQARRGREGRRPDRGQPHRARADAGQGARRRQGSRRDEAPRGHLPRPHPRRDRQELHDRAHGNGLEARCVPAVDRARRDPRDGAHRRVGDRTGRTDICGSRPKATQRTQTR